MLKQEIEVGKSYQAKVSGRLTEVKITAISQFGGWDAINVLTGREVRIKTARRLRQEVTRSKKTQAARNTVNAFRQHGGTIIGKALGLKPGQSSPKSTTTVPKGKTALKAPQGAPWDKEAGKATKSAPGLATAASKALRAAMDGPAAPKGKSDAPGPPVGKMSGLDAAAIVLWDSGQPMGTKEIFDAIVKKGLWTSNAPTPCNTLYSAIFREIKSLGRKTRFVKAGRGKFTLRPDLLRKT